MLECQDVVAVAALEAHQQPIRLAQQALVHAQDVLGVAALDDHAATGLGLIEAA